MTKKVQIPHDLEKVLDIAWDAAKNVPGFLAEDEARFLGLLAACTPGEGNIVEIGSFKGRSTVMLSKVARHYGKGNVVAIDPHNFNNAELHEHRLTAESTSFLEFQENLRGAGVYDCVDIRLSYSHDVALQWNKPIRLLWIDGDHSYTGAKTDYDDFSPFVVENGVIALHDALREFSGPIRVFVEDMLRSSKFGGSGFIHSIAWSQFCPDRGTRYEKQRMQVERVAKKLIPFLKDEKPLHGFRKIQYKLYRSRVPRKSISPELWADLVNCNA